MMTCLQHKPGSWTRSVLNYYEEAILGEFFLKVEFLEGVVCAFQGVGTKVPCFERGAGWSGVARGFGDGRGQVLQQVTGEVDLTLPADGFGFFCAFEF